MNVVEISKYRPSLMKHGRYLREDWISYSNIGEVFDGVPLTRDEYLRVEDRYVAAMMTTCQLASLRSLYAHDVEHWDLADDHLRRFVLDDVLDGSSPPAEGEELTGARLRNVLKRCLRQVAWMEFVVPESLLIHPSHDLRWLVATELDPAAIRARGKELGLFTYSTDAHLETLDSWRAGRTP